MPLQESEAQLIGGGTTARQSMLVELKVVAVEPVLVGVGGFLAGIEQNSSPGARRVDTTYSQQKKGQPHS